MIYIRGIMKHTETSKKVKDGKTIYYQSWLPDKKLSAILIVVHGLGEHSSRYGTHFVEFYIKENIGVISFDLPGHGKSYGKKGHIDDPVLLLEIIDDVIKNTKYEYPNLPLFIYGHSFGGEISLWYTLVRRPDVNGVILTSPLIGPKVAVPPMKMLLAKTMEKLLPSFSLNNGLEPEKLSRDPEIVNQYISDPFVHPLVSAKTGMMIINRGKWIMENAHFNTNDILLMVGGKEEIVNLEVIDQFYKKAPYVTYKIWPNLYHEIHNEPEKQEVFIYTLKWIKEHLNS